MSYKVVLASSFKKCVKRLKKGYPRVNKDVTEVVHELVIDPTIGAVIPGGEGTRKIRVRNSDAGKGKRGGYRLIYFVSEGREPLIYLLLLYSKADQSDVTQQELSALLAEISGDLEA